jgi:hypothetical protein
LQAAVAAVVAADSLAVLIMVAAVAAVHLTAPVVLEA